MGKFNVEELDERERKSYEWAGIAIPDHGEGVTFPDGSHYEPQVGKTKWFTAEQAERGKTELRSVIDKTVEAVNAITNAKDPERSLRAAAESKIPLGRLQFWTSDGEALQRLGVFVMSWNEVADLFVGETLDEEKRQVVIEAWRTHLIKTRNPVKRLFCEDVVKDSYSKSWGFWSKNGWFKKIE